MSKQLDLVRTNLIKALLLSQTTDNTALVVEKMAEGNLNKILLSYLTAIVLKHPKKAVQERAQAVLQQHAPPKLQTHVQRYLGRSTKPYYESAELYYHSSIYFFDAILAEKMIFWHHQVGELSAEPTVIRLHHRKWQKQHARISEIPFIDTIVLHKMQKFDFQHFMQAIEPMKINYIHFYHLYNVVTPINMEVLCHMPTLKMLLFDGNREHPVLDIPKTVTAPIHLLCIRQCNVKNLENFAPYMNQFTHLLIE